MRKQSRVTIVAPKSAPAIVAKDTNEAAAEAALHEINKSMNLISPPNPFDRGPAPVKVSYSTQMPLYSNSSIVSTGKRHSMRKQASMIKRKQSDVPVEETKGFEAIKASSKKASSLVDSMAKEDMRWANVPDKNYHEYRDSDFVFKLNENQLETLFQGVRRMEFDPALVTEPSHGEMLVNNREEIISKAIELRAKDRQKIVAVYDKFRKFRKQQDAEFAARLKRITDEKGLQRLETRLRERELQVARLERVVGQKKQFIDIIEQFGTASSSEQIRALIELNAQDDIQLLVHALDEVGDCIAERLSEKLAMSEEISRLREQIVRHMPNVDQFDEEHTIEMQQKEKELRLKLEAVQRDLSKAITNISKANEMILVMDMKAESKEEHLRMATTQSPEYIEIESLKKSITRLKDQKREYDIQAKELEEVLKQRQEDAIKASQRTLARQQLPAEESETDDDDDELNKDSSITVPETLTPDPEALKPSHLLKAQQEHAASRRAPPVASALLSTERRPANTIAGESTSTVAAYGLSASRKADPHEEYENFVVSEYTKKFEQILDAALQVNTSQRLLPNELDQIEDISFNDSKQWCMIDNIRDAQIKRRISRLDSLAGGILDTETPPADEVDAELEELDLEGYGLEAVAVQLRRIRDIIHIEPEEDESTEITPIAPRRNAEAGILLEGNISSLLGVDDQGKLLNEASRNTSCTDSGSENDSDSGNESDSSAKSSRSYLKGSDIYRTRKKLMAAIVRRRNKLKELRDKGNKLDNKLNKLKKYLKGEESKRTASYQNIIKLARGDTKKGRKATLYFSEVELNSIRDRNKKLRKEKAMWQRKLTSLLKTPAKELEASKSSLSSNPATVDGTLQHLQHSSTSRSSDIQDMSTPHTQDASQSSESDRLADGIDLTSGKSTADRDSAKRSDRTASIPQAALIECPEPRARTGPAIIEKSYSQELMEYATRSFEEALLAEDDENIFDDHNKLLEKLLTSQKNLSAPQKQRLQTEFGATKLPTLEQSLKELQDFIKIERVDVPRSPDQLGRQRTDKRVKVVIGDTSDGSVFNGDSNFLVRGMNLHSRESNQRTQKDQGVGQEGTERGLSARLSLPSFPSTHRSNAIDSEGDVTATIVYTGNAGLLEEDDEEKKSKIDGMSTEPVPHSDINDSVSINLSEFEGPKQRSDNASVPTATDSRPTSYMTPTTAHRKYLSSAQLDHSRNKNSPAPVYNYPRFAGENSVHGSPAVVDMFSAALNTVPEAKPASVMFTSHKLNTSKNWPDSVGKYVRQDEPDEAHSESVDEPMEIVSDVDRYKSSLFARSIVTRQLIGRSSWDRVVGMHSEFVREYILSQLRDPRIVFIINTADTEREKDRSAIRAMYSNAPSLDAKLDSTCMPWLGKSETLIPPCLMHANSGDAVSSLELQEEESEAYDSFPVISAEDSCISKVIPQLTVHEPIAPKPSFSPRKRSMHCGK
mmetsp:Transcript_5119/g.7835  ORF Transcript_5119/g.7835 Transcript_5119/m.7835 type:complete len:1459 (+) Transcript_5119:59-4435(+)